MLEGMFEHATVPAPRLSAAKYAPATVTVLIAVPALAALTVNDTEAVTAVAPLAVLDSVTLPEVSAVALMAGNATLVWVSTKAPLLSNVEMATPEVAEEPGAAVFVKPDTVHVTGRLAVETAAAVENAMIKLGLA